MHTTKELSTGSSRVIHNVIHSEIHRRPDSHNSGANTVEAHLRRDLSLRRWLRADEARKNRIPGAQLWRKSRQEVICAPLSVPSGMFHVKRWERCHAAQIRRTHPELRRAAGASSGCHTTIAYPQGYPQGYPPTTDPFSTGILWTQLRPNVRWVVPPSSAKLSRAHGHPTLPQSIEEMRSHDRDHRTETAGLSRGRALADLGRSNTEDQHAIDEHTAGQATDQSASVPRPNAILAVASSRGGQRTRAIHNLACPPRRYSVASASPDEPQDSVQHWTTRFTGRTA